MVGGRLSYFFTHRALLLLWACLHDVEASSCERIIHKKAGDTVELWSCLKSEGVTSATWKHRNTIIVDKDIGVTHPQFVDRVLLNPTNFSLTVIRLTPQDSGIFSFSSEVDNKQRETVSITLQVHELITKEPILTINKTWHASNESCTVVLDCIATSNTNVSYNWTVRNQTRSNSRLQYNMQPKDGNINFTCTIFNFVSEKSAFKPVMCSNDTSEPEPDVLILSAAAGCCLIIIVVGTAVGVFHCKQRRAAGSDSNDLTVYADISDVAIEGRTSPTMKSCSVYETIGDGVNAVTSGPHTVYDKIQLNRVRNPPVSPYQEVC